MIDEGEGIPSGEVESVFDKFYRVQSGDHKRAGTGLGLAIARGFVEANAGTLTIDDAPGGGTCMRVALPTMKVGEEVRA